MMSANGRLAFLPHRLVDDELQVLVLVHPRPAVAADHGAEDLAAVLVEHLHRDVPRRRVADREELSLHRADVGGIAQRLALGDRLGQPHPRDDLPHRAHGHDVRHALVVVGGVRAVDEVAGEAALAVAREVEAEVERRAELQVAEVAARPAVALHGAEDGHHPRPLHARRAAAGAADTHAPASCAEVGLLAAPLACQCAHVAGGHARFLFLPFGRLGHAVALAEDVGLPFVEARRPLLDELLVVQPLGDPDVAQRLGQGRVGAGLRRNPLAAEVGGGVVEIGIDVDHLDAELARPLATARALEAVGRVRVAGPEHDHLGFLQAVLHGAVELRAAQSQAVAPVVHGAPEPALPAVRAVHHRVVPIRFQKRLKALR